MMVGPFRVDGLTYTWLAFAYALCEDPRTSDIDKQYINPLKYIRFNESMLPDVIHKHSFLDYGFPEKPNFYISPLLYILKETYADPSGSVESSHVIEKNKKSLTQIAKKYGWTLEQLLSLWEREQRRREPITQISPEAFWPVFDLVVSAIVVVRKEQKSNKLTESKTIEEIDRTLQYFQNTGRSAFTFHYYNFDRNKYPYECNIERFKSNLFFMDPHHWCIKNLRPGVFSCLDLLPYTLVEMRQALGNNKKNIAQPSREINVAAAAIDSRLQRIADYIGGTEG